MLHSDTLPAALGLPPPFALAPSSLLPPAASPGEAASPGHESLGTTIASIIYDKGILLAADTRTSAGEFVSNRFTRKFKRITSRIYSLTSGTSSHTQFVCDLTKKYVNYFALNMGIPENEVPVKFVANIMRKIVYINRNILSTGLIVSGVDKMGPHCFQIIPGGGMTEHWWAISGSGSTYIWGLIDNKLEGFKGPDGFVGNGARLPKDDEGKKMLTREEAFALLRGCVGRAMYRDGSSGGIIRTVDISNEGKVTEEWVKSACE